MLRFKEQLSSQSNLSATLLNNMLTELKKSLWKHFGASIDMLGNAVAMWPDENWNTKKKFFYNAYHCLVFLDYYLTIPPKDFISPLPYTLTEPEHIPIDAIDDVVPNRIYSKKELLDYLQFSRKKCHDFIAGLTEEKLNEPWISGSGNMNLDLASSGSLSYSVLDILLYNMKHVQHHAAQLNLLLRQTINNAPDYVSMAEDDL
jgi:DinB superfamily